MKVDTNKSPGVHVADDTFVQLVLQTMIALFEFADEDEEEEEDEDDEEKNAASAEERIDGISNDIVLTISTAVKAIPTIYGQYGFITNLLCRLKKEAIPESIDKEEYQEVLNRVLNEFRTRLGKISEEKTKLALAKEDAPSEGDVLKGTKKDGKENDKTPKKPPKRWFATKEEEERYTPVTSFLLVWRDLFDIPELQKKMNTRLPSKCPMLVCPRWSKNTSCLMVKETNLQHPKRCKREIVCDCTGGTIDAFAMVAFWDITDPFHESAPVALFWNQMPHHQATYDDIRFYYVNNYDRIPECEAVYFLKLKMDSLLAEDWDRSLTYEHVLGYFFQQFGFNPDEHKEVAERLAAIFEDKGYRMSKYRTKEVQKIQKDSEKKEEEKNENDV